VLYKIGALPLMKVSPWVGPGRAVARCGMSVWRSVLLLGQRNPYGANLVHLQCQPACGALAFLLSGQEIHDQRPVPGPLRPTPLAAMLVNGALTRSSPPRDKAGGPAA